MPSPLSHTCGGCHIPELYIYYLFEYTFRILSIAFFRLIFVYFWCVLGELWKGVSTIPISTLGLFLALYSGVMPCGA